ncbi:GatB/YqeY domain-containing protein [Piptocephalis cylindrospora]|uniref:Altered inheritance of mitochondria protein 41 n=1 Tax=Piptocephalis cylindrospora TaxID=1907219 RepID=A0A4P9Y0I6_9FUNG|nr:GatB/YqeY domain-containing protein [Piptocephalis cylindrospora]|eukprot:RKP11982.1 GatB/YqeY domain-containing protein [Piptocephalis cylindrospora]
MRAKEKQRLTVIKSVVSGVTYAKKSALASGNVEAEKAAEEDASVVSVIRKAIKTREDSVSTYTAAGRADLAETEKAEVALLRQYLPTPYTSEELAQAVDDAITSVGASTIKDMGRVMREVKLDEARLDRKALSDAVKARLSRSS